MAHLVVRPHPGICGHRQESQSPAAEPSQVPLEADGPGSEFRLVGAGDATTVRCTGSVGGESMCAVIDDEEMARRVEAVYMTPDVVEQRRATRAVLSLQPGERVLDIGSGPGFLAAEMAGEVGTDGRVYGIDPSESMLASAGRRDAPVEFGPGDALVLPFPDEQFDVAVCTQVYEYVEDIAAALAEARRVLRPGGRLLVLDTDWDSIVWHSSDRERMERVLPPGTSTSLTPTCRGGSRGLCGPPASSDAVRDHPDPQRRRRPQHVQCRHRRLVAAFVAGRGGVTETEATAWEHDLAGLGDDYFFSLNRYLFVAERS